MYHLTLEVRQLAVTKLQVDESDLKKIGLTTEEIEEACLSQEKLTELFNTGKLNTLLPSIIEATELLNINIIDKEFDDDLIILGGH